MSRAPRLVKATMRELDVTQRDLSRMTGISRQVIGMITRGQMKVSLKLAIDLRNGLGPDYENFHERIIKLQQEDENDKEMQELLDMMD